MREAVLNMLRDDARLTAADIARRLGQEEKAVAETIEDLERARVIIGYHALVDDFKSPNDGVMAVIEVQARPEREGGFDRIASRLAKFPEVSSLYLMSGGYDLQLVVRGQNLQEVAAFVSGKLAVIEGVMATTTRFLLKKYKEAGKLFIEGGQHERLKVSP